MHQGKQAGACYVTGGDRAGQRGYFVRPTVIKDVKPDMSIVREEIFGPVVVAEPFTKAEELIPRANQTRTASPQAFGRATFPKRIASPPR